MPSPLRYDFTRTMRSKSVLGTMAVLILLSFAMVPLVKMAQTPPFYSSGGTAVVGYHSGSEYRMLAYSYNAYGQPVAGTRLNLTVTGQSGTESYSTSTNSSGFSSWSLPAPSQGQPIYNLYSGGSLVSSGSIPVGVGNGQVFGIAGQNLASVEDPANSSRRDALFFYMGPNGTAPTMYEVRFNYTYGSGSPYTLPNKAHTIFLGTPTTYVSSFPIPDVPRNATMMTLEVFDANDTAFLASTYSIVVPGGGYVAPTPEEAFSLFMSAVLVLVVPLMAILVAYNSYGKDKATGVLESVLARPVTRRGLATSRYIAFVGAMSAALLVTMGVMELISQGLLGGILPPLSALYAVGALIVEAAAFTGIIMLLAHFIRSQGNIMLVGIGLWIVLDFLWSVFTLLAASVLGVQVGSGNYSGLTLQSSFFNPAQFYSLIGAYLNGVSTTGFGGSTNISAATYGVTPLTLGLDAAIWVVAPLALLLYFSSRRD